MKSKYFALALVTIAVTGIVAYKLKKNNHKNNRRLEDVADAGYETAHDILYPLDKRRMRSW